MVNSILPIPDVYCLDLVQEGNQLVLLRDSDHMLRRFGQVEIRELKEGEISQFVFREAADEIWSVTQGEVDLLLVDKRLDSPSENQAMKLTLSEHKPQTILIPFGVAFGFVAKKSTKMIRIATHADGTHPEDKIFPPEEIFNNL